MNLIIETTFRSEKDRNKDVESFTVLCDIDAIQNIINTKGVEAANTALDSYVAKFTEDFKRKLSTALRKV